MAIHQGNSKNINYIKVSFPGIVPLTYINHHNISLCIGDVVLAPIRNKERMGIVIEINDNDPELKHTRCRSIKYKSITSKVSSIPIKYINAFMVYSSISLRSFSTVINNIWKKAFSEVVKIQWQEPINYTYKKIIIHDSIIKRIEQYKAFCDKASGIVVIISKNPEMFMSQLKKFSPILVNSNLDNLDLNTKVIISSWSFITSLPIYNIEYIIIDKPEDDIYENSYNLMHALDFSNIISIYIGKKIVLGQESPSIDQVYRVSYNPPSIREDFSCKIHNSNNYYFKPEMNNIFTENVKMGIKNIVIFNGSWSHCVFRCKSCSYINSSSCCNSKILICKSSKTAKCSSCYKNHKYIDCCLSCSSISILEKMHSKKSIAKDIFAKTNFSVSLNLYNTESKVIIISQKELDEVIEVYKENKICIMSMGVDRIMLSPRKAEEIFSLDKVYKHVSNIYWKSAFAKNVEALHFFCDEKNISPFFHKNKIDLNKLLSHKEIISRKYFSLPPYGRCVSIENYRLNEKFCDLCYTLKDILNDNYDDSKLISHKNNIIFFSIRNECFLKIMKIIDSKLLKLIGNFHSKIKCNINVKSIGCL